MYSSRKAVEIFFPDDLKVAKNFTNVDYCDAYKIEIPKYMDVSVCLAVF